MRVVVTGAGGLVGRAAVKHFTAQGLAHRDLDITDAAAVERTISDLRPDLIINCAVLGVDECQRDPVAARAINVDGPAFLARAAERMWSPHGRVLTLTTPTRMYQASYRLNGPLDEQTPVETLIDPVSDPQGLHDLSASEPRTLARFRRLATVYATVYPWLVVSGKSGVPPSLLHAAPTSAPHKVANSAAKSRGINQ